MPASLSPAEDSVRCMGVCIGIDWLRNQTGAVLRRLRLARSRSSCARPSKPRLRLEGPLLATGGRGLLVGPLAPLPAGAIPFCRGPDPPEARVPVAPRCCCWGCGWYCGGMEAWPAWPYCWGSRGIQEAAGFQAGLLGPDCWRCWAASAARCWRPKSTARGCPVLLVGGDDEAGCVVPLEPWRTGTAWAALVGGGPAAVVPGKAGLKAASCPGRRPPVPVLLPVALEVAGEAGREAKEGELDRGLGSARDWGKAGPVRPAAAVAGGVAKVSEALEPRREVSMTDTPRLLAVSREPAGAAGIALEHSCQSVKRGSTS